VVANLNKLKVRSTRYGRDFGGGESSKMNGETLAVICAKITWKIEKELEK
jgi:hypothetical protein